jgi:hypothetical protein
MSGPGGDETTVAAGQEGAHLQPAGRHPAGPLRVRRARQPWGLAHQDGRGLCCRHAGVRGAAHSSSCT